MAIDSLTSLHRLYIYAPVTLAPARSNVYSNMTTTIMSMKSATRAMTLVAVLSVSVVVIVSAVMSSGCGGGGSCGGCGGRRETSGA